MKTDRLASLDVFRGVTIAGMILVNNPGSWSFIYNKFLVPWAGPLNGSLLYPIILLLIWLAILRPLYRKKIFIKI